MIVDFLQKLKFIIEFFQWLEKCFFSKEENIEKLKNLFVNSENDKHNNKKPPNDSINGGQTMPTVAELETRLQVLRDDDEPLLQGAISLESLAKNYQTMITVAELETRLQALRENDQPSVLTDDEMIIDMEGIPDDYQIIPTVTQIEARLKSLRAADETSINYEVPLIISDTKEVASQLEVRLANLRKNDKITIDEEVISIFSDCKELLEQLEIEFVNISKNNQLHLEEEVPSNSSDTKELARQLEIRFTSLKNTYQPTTDNYETTSEASVKNLVTNLLAADIKNNSITIMDNSDTNALLVAPSEMTSMEEHDDSEVHNLFLWKDLAAVITPILTTHQENIVALNAKDQQLLEWKDCCLVENDPLLNSNKVIKLNNL